MRNPRWPGFERLRAWVLRYAPLEAAALATALYAGMAADQISENQLAIGYAAAWGENFGYYLVAFARERRRRGASAAALADLVLEFGPAEAVDSLVVRPLCMGFGVGHFGDAAGGVVLGKLLADVPFYAFAALGHALRRRIRP